MLYFISDTHFYHENILKLNPDFRFPFFEEVILENLEKTLKPGDILYHLGDFTWHLDDRRGILRRWKALPCRKVLVRGNHDSRFSDRDLGEFFDEIEEFSLVVEHSGVRLLLSHYPALDLRTGRFPDLQLEVERTFTDEGCDLLIHGHVHRGRDGRACGCCLKGIPCFNVNVEYSDFRPVSLQDILDRSLKGRPLLYPPS